jgi:hypothetical protein
MVCEGLQELEWNFIQARAGSLNIDSLEWTNRALTGYWITSRRGTRANTAPKIKYHSEKKDRFYIPEWLHGAWSIAVNPNISRGA